MKLVQSGQTGLSMGILVGGEAMICSLQAVMCFFSKVCGLCGSPSLVWIFVRYNSSYISGTHQNTTYHIHTSLIAVWSHSTFLHICYFLLYLMVRHYQLIILGLHIRDENVIMLTYH